MIDLCAGAGGKTLALAAMMEGRGRLVATDDDKRRLAPIYDRLSRGGAPQRRSARAQIWAQRRAAIRSAICRAPPTSC